MNVNFPSYSIEYFTSTLLYTIPVGKKENTLTQTYQYLNAQLLLTNISVASILNPVNAGNTGLYIQINYNANYLNKTNYLLCSVTYDPTIITTVSQAIYCTEGYNTQLNIQDNTNFSVPTQYYPF